MAPRSMTSEGALTDPALVDGEGARAACLTAVAILQL